MIIIAAELADYIITELNKILLVDRDAVEALIEHRVECNEALRAHPTVQVVDGNKVGLLGLLNGIVGTISDGPRQGWGYITGVYDDDGKLVQFQRTKENP
jgi:hypothetical protein